MYQYTIKTWCVRVCVRVCVNGANLAEDEAPVRSQLDGNRGDDVSEGGHERHCHEDGLRRHASSPQGPLSSLSPCIHFSVHSKPAMKLLFQLSSTRAD